MKIAFTTLGCRLNQYESDSLITQFKKNGYRIVKFSEIADAYIINTCTVTNKSDYKSRNAINRAINKNPEALIVVTGCYADTDPKDIENIEGVDLIIDNAKKHSIVDSVMSLLTGKNIKSAKKDYFNFPAPVDGEHTRSYLKIQDGCDNYCAYCKIPYARGNPKSRTKEDTLNVFKTLITSGIKEIVLTGINIGKYSGGIAPLLKDLIKIEGKFRIHLSSIEMNFVSNELLELFKNDKTCKHLHVPLQSGSNKTLKLMNRNYTTEEFSKLIHKIKKVIPDINLTSDIIVGFPGETDEDHVNTINLLKELKFSHIHTFKYSLRTGTPASEMKNQINGKVKSLRSEEIRKLSEKFKSEYLKKYLNQKLRILVEQNKIIDDEIYSTGKSDEYIAVYVKGKHPCGEFVNCILINTNPDFTIAELI